MNIRRNLGILALPVALLAAGCALKHRSYSTIETRLYRGMTSDKKPYALRAEVYNPGGISSYELTIEGEDPNHYIHVTSSSIDSDSNGILDPSMFWVHCGENTQASVLFEENPQSRDVPDVNGIVSNKGNCQIPDRKKLRVEIESIVRRHK